MFPISYEALLAAISVSIGLAAAIMVGYWWDKLWSWTQNVVKASPKIVCEFCLFCKSVVWRLSNILLGGAFGLYWAFYVQLTGKSLPMNVFWSFVVILFVFACFGAWREQ